MERSKLAVAAAFLSGLGLFDAALAPILARLGAVSPMAAFEFWGMGSLAGLFGLLVGVLALWPTGSGGKSGRPLSLFGVAAGAVLFLVIAFNAASGGSYPPINDVTTDLADPPAFADDPSGRGRDMGYPSDFVDAATASYRDLVPIETANPPDRALELAAQTAAGLGWQVVRTDRATGTVLARQTTAIFRFVDDIVIRVRPRGAGSVVDLRSKSRDGRGDIGANAIRIRAFAEAYPR